MDKTILLSGVHKGILEYVGENPGTHEIEVARQLDRPWGTFHYQVGQLIGQKHLSGDKDGKLKRLYIPEHLGYLQTVFEGQPLGIVHIKVLQYLSGLPRAGIIAITNALGSTRKGTYPFLEKLQERNLAEEQKSVAGGKYRITAAGSNLLARLNLGLQLPDSSEALWKKLVSAQFPQVVLLNDQNPKPQTGIAAESAIQ